MKRLKARLLPMALGLLLAVLCLPRTALAYDAIPDLNRPCSLTLTCNYEGVAYELYKVCDVDNLANFTPTEDFAAMSSTINRLIDARNWQDLTDTLVTTLDGREPGWRTVSNAYGVAKFEDLPVGLYLVVGRETEVAPGKFYRPTNFMVCLPNWEKPGDNQTSSGDGEWTYDVKVVNKGTEREGDTITLSALKIWRDGGSISRPASVTVQLLCRERNSGTRFEPYGAPVVLDRENNFSTIWSKLDNVNYEWIVREVNVPGGYDVSYSQQGTNIVITNTYDPGPGPGSDPDPDPPKSDPDPDPPGDPKDPPSDPGSPNDPSDPPDGPPNIPGEDIDDPDTPLSKPPVDEEEIEEWDPEEEEDIDDPDTPLARLPQTGVLWWPVPFLAMGGLFLFVLGWALNRREYEE